MSNISLTSNIANIVVTNTPSNISVTDTSTNVTISNIVTATTSVAVTSTQSNVIVSATSKADVVDVRTALSATTTAGSFGSLTYSNTTGIFNLSGPFNSDIRAAISGTSPIGFNQSTGVISIDSSAVFSGKTTDDLAEGSTNLYYTTARSNSAIAAYQGSIDTPGNISGNVFTGNTVIAGASNITDMVGTNLTVTSATINGALSIDTLATGNITITEPLRPNITLKATDGSFGPTEANIYLNPSSNGLVIGGSLVVGSSNDTLKADKILPASSPASLTLTNYNDTANILLGDTVSGALNNAWVQGGNVNILSRVSGGGAVYLGSNLDAQSFKVESAGNIVTMFDTNNSVNVIRYPNIKVTEIRGSGGTGVPHSADLAIYNYRKSIHGANVTPSNITGQSNIHLGTVNEAWFKGFNVNNYAGRMLISNSSTFGSTFSSLPGTGVRALTLHYNEYDLTGNLPYLQMSATDGSWTSTSGTNGIQVTSGGYVLNTQSEFTGTQSIEGNIHTVGLLTSNANISTIGTFSAGNSATQTHTFTGNVDITGNIEVSGNLNYRNVEDLYVRDQTITLNANATTDATIEIIANRPQSTYDAKLVWNEPSETWTFMNGDNVFQDMLTVSQTRGLVSVTSASASGGGSLAYDNSSGVFTFAPAVPGISLTDISISTNTPSGNGALAYNNSTGAFTFTPADVPNNTDELSEGSTNQYFTTARANSAIDGYVSGGYGITYSSGAISLTNSEVQAQANIAIGNNSTSDLSEGTNLYYTTARANTNIANGLGNFASNIVSTANITGSYLLGNGSQLTGITADFSGKTTSDLPEGTNLYFTNTRADARVNAVLPNTDSLSEGSTNLYYTTARANTAIAAYTGGLTNLTGNVNTTGNISCGNIAISSKQILDLNSITSKADNDKFTFKALLGGDNTSTIAGNITSDGYEVIIDGNHTYDSAGNIAQSGTNNLNGYAVSGAFVKGSPIFTLTGVTQLKNVYNSAGNIDGTNNNVSLTGDMVANMIPDQNYAAYAVGGDQYPLPRGTRVASANTTAIVFTESALANVTAANATNDATQGPFAIMHGAYDSKNGQIMSFLSQDDAVADGTVISSFNPAQFPITTLTNVGGGSGTGIEDGNTLTMNLNAVTIPVGTAVTMANVTGTGATNVNGVTFYVLRDVNGDGYNYTLATDAGLTTAASAVTLGIDVSGSFPSATQNGDITYTVAQSTATISKARLYLKDAYGYPATGPTENDFAYTVGSASDYNVDLTAASTSFRGRTSLEAPKQTLKAPIGLTIGGNATMSNRGDSDSFTNFGIAQVWDGTLDYGNLYAGSSNTSLIPQMLFKTYTDKTFSDSVSGMGRGGPRILFASSTGNIDTDEFDKYPRASQELGRLTFWGPTKTFGETMSTVNPPGFISATAQSDWDSTNKLDMHFAANGDGANNSDIFLSYTNGKVIIGSGTDGSSKQAIHFAPAITTTTGNAAQAYATLGHTWANVNYANVSASTGSKLTVTQGGAGSTTDGDLAISIDRDYIAGSTALTINAAGDGGILSEQLAGIGSNAQVCVTTTTSSADIVNGAAVTLSGVTGTGSAGLNGQTFYIGAGTTYFDGGGANKDSFSLWEDAGLTNPLLTTEISMVAFIGSGTATITTTGTSAREWQFKLDQSSEDLKLYNNGVLHSSFKDSNSEFNTQNAVVTGTLTPTKTVLKQFNETVVALGNQTGNIAAQAAFNGANASIFTLTATDAITISQIPNADAGSSYTIKITQDGTGSRALTSTFKFAGGDKTLSTAAASIDVINVVYDGTDYLATLSKAYS